MLIRAAKKEDIPEIFRLAESNVLDETKPKQDDGFLVSSYSQEDYLNFLKDAEKIDTSHYIKKKKNWFYKKIRIPRVVFLVAVDGDEILGFVLAYSSGYVRSKKKEKDKVIFKASSEFGIEELLHPRTDYLIIKQVCIAPNRKKKGVAKHLYIELFEETEQTHIFATIVTDPRNEASESFHEKLGFSPIFHSLSKSDRFRKGRYLYNKVWYRSRKPRIFKYRVNFADQSSIKKDSESASYDRELSFKDIDSSSDALAASLEHARELYLHEDNLNWTKLGVMITILFAVMASYWGVLSGADEDNFWLSASAFALLAVTGGSVLTMMLQKLISGRMFMATHKDSLRIAEARLARVASASYPAIWHVPVTSDTVNLLQYMPVIALTIYSIATGIGIFYLVTFFC